MLWQRTCTPSRVRLVEADGPGIPGRAVGCIASGLKMSLASNLKVNNCPSIRSYQRTGPAFASTFGTRRQIYEIAVENPLAEGCGVLWVTLDGMLIDDQLIPLQNDGNRHSVVVRLGTQDPNETSESESRF